MADTKKIVLNILKKKGKPMGPGDIAKVAGLDSKEVSMVVKELKKRRACLFPRKMFYTHRRG